MMNRKILACIALACALCLPLAACGQAVDTQSEFAETASSIVDETQSPSDAQASSDPAGTEEPVETSSEEDNAIVITGYKVYENDLFKTEIPENWNVKQIRGNDERMWADVIGKDVTPDYESHDSYPGIYVDGWGADREFVQKLYKNFQTDVKRYFETTVAGEEAYVIDLQYQSPLASTRTFYTSTPDGSVRYFIKFITTTDAPALDFSEIQDVIDHFLDHLEYK